MNEANSKYWLMKTEPDVFSFEDLVARPNRVEPWDGIRNYQARNFMRDDFKLGQSVFIYHSNCAIPGIAGIAEVVAEAYPDHTALDPKSKYFDKKSNEAGASRWVMVDVKATHVMANYVSLASLKDLSALDGLPLLQRGQRLSIQPVSSEHWNVICRLGKPVLL